MIVVLAAAAEGDLERICGYIARNSPQRALSFLGELKQSCLSLADMPAAFPVVPRYSRLGIRRKVHGNYLIFYRVAEQTVEILHILNGAMDYEGVLFPDDDGEIG